MENFFDIATPKELEILYEEKPGPDRLARARALLEADADLHYQYLFFLYLDRGDKKKAHACLEMIKDQVALYEAKMLTYVFSDSRPLAIPFPHTKAREALKPKENYFDIATLKELEEHFAEKPTSEEIRRFRIDYEIDPDLNYVNLFLLFLDRGDKKTAEKYLDKINDPRRRLEATMTAYECAG